MSKSGEKALSARILDGLSSLKLTLFVFFTLAAASVVGTLLPQGAGPGELEGRYTPAMVQLIETFSLTNLYHSTWFRVLLLLLCVNLLVCTVDRLPKTVRLLKRKEEPFGADKLSKFGSSAVVSTKLSPEQAGQLLQRALSETFGAAQTIESPGRYCGVIEKGRWSRLMVYGVHASVLLVIAGALVGSLFGFKGNMNISQGSASDEVTLTDGHSTVKLPFQVKCEKFEVTFYDTGAPKEFRSDLAIIENGREVLKQPIVVNDPLSHEGITFYQASYGTVLKSADIELTVRDTGRKARLTVPYRGAVPIPETEDLVSITEFQENLMRFGPALGMVIGRKDTREAPAGSWVLADRPNFHGNTIQNYQIRVLSLDRTNYTGLQVNRDPGIWLVYLGFTLMLVGIGLTFYSSHDKVWACIEPDRKGRKTIVAVAARASRDTAGFNEKFDRLAARLNDLFDSEKVKEDRKKK